MAVLNFGPYQPDASDFNQGHTSSVLNVLPRADGYGPMPSANVFSGAMAAACRGMFFARNTDGTIRIFAGTSNKLYSLDNTTLEWTDVSKGATTYSALSSNANWSFAQFGAVVIACQANDAVQAFTLGSSSAFADLGGSPPNAAYVTVVNRFLVLSGLASNPRRVFWSGLNAITTWSSGTTYSDFQDLPDGGNVMGVVGGEFGVIIQQNAIRRMTFAPGSDIVFQIERLARDVGTIHPYSIIDASGMVALYSTKGFMMIGGDGSMTPIGRERVDRTFDAAFDSSEPQLVIGASYPGSNRLVWVYKTEDYNASAFNRALVYDTVLDRWSPIVIEGQTIASMARPGITLESLDTIGQVAISNAADNGSGLIRLTVASTSGWTTGDYKTIADVGGTTEANGSWTITVVNGTTIDLQGSTFSNTYTSGGYVAGSIDDLDISLDDFSAATLNQLAIVDTDNKLAYFVGDNLEATLETAEQSAPGRGMFSGASVGRRMLVRGFYPVTDAATVYASTGYRESMTAASSYTSETAINSQGFCPQRRSTRHARARIRIPAGTEWTFITGVEPDIAPLGRR